MGQVNNVKYAFLLKLQLSKNTERNILIQDFQINNHIYLLNFKYDNEKGAT